MSTMNPVKSKTGVSEAHFAVLLLVISFPSDGESTIYSTSHPRGCHSILSRPTLFGS